MPLEDFKIQSNPSYKGGLSSFNQRPALGTIFTPVDNLDKYSSGFLGIPGTNEQEELHRYRANKQTNWEKASNALLRGGAKAAISVLEPLGHLLDIEHYLLEWESPKLR